MCPRYLCADSIPGIGHVLLCKNLAEPEEIMAELQCYLTKCPNCGEPNSSQARRFKNSGELVMTTVEAKMLCDVKQNNILLAPALVPLYIKRCNKCGFVSFFDATIIARNGKL